MVPETLAVEIFEYWPSDRVCVEVNAYACAHIMLCLLSINVHVNVHTRFQEPF
jgi:hypothetical protein